MSLYAFSLTGFGSRRYVKLNDISAEEISNNVQESLDAARQRRLESDRQQLFDSRPRRPSLTAEPEDLQADIGERVYMRCSAEGSPTPAIAWFHNR